VLKTCTCTFMCVISGLNACRLAPKFLTIQTPETFQNRNVIHYHLEIFTKIFSVLNWWKIGIFSQGRKNSILIKKSVGVNRIIRLPCKANRFNRLARLTFVIYGHISFSTEGRMEAQLPCFYVIPFLHTQLLICIYDVDLVFA